MSEPFIAEIRIFAGNFCAAWLGFLQRPVAAYRSKYCTFFTYWNNIWRRWTYNNCLTQSTGPGSDAPRPGSRLDFSQARSEGWDVETVTLSEAQMPNHTHTIMAASNPGDLQIPNSDRALARTQPGFAWGPANNLASLTSAALPNAGGSQSHNNLQPFLAMNFIIALVGLYPSRS